jgi:hydroxymethylpyrimidine pyrophosphatase-like HAD family hydrolase
MDENGAVVYEARCAEVNVPELLAELFGYGCKYAHIGSERYLCVAENRENIPSYVSEDAARLFKECPSIDHFYQISVQLPSAEEALAVVEKINDKYAKWLNPLQNGRCIDIVPVGVNKAQGMYRVMEFFGCQQQDVITVGDNVNDLDMLRSFHSYAMENGVEETKKIADGVVSDVTEVIERELSL